jgi:tetratricopeptide (TPR) repeat protein
MELSKIKDFKTEVERNRIQPPTETYCEKNWMPILDMPFHYVKWTNPTEIVKVSKDKKKAETVKLVHQKTTFPRDLRGGSQVINIGDYYVCLTHEVDLWKNEQNKKDAIYYHRFIVWDKEWNIVASSEELNFMTAKIEFTCGMTFDGNNLIIPFGFQDSTAFILKLPLHVFENICGIKIKKLNVEKQNPTPAKLEKFIFDPYNATNAFELAEHYFNLGHTASALSFYLRCAEYSKDDDLTYEALLMVAKCIAIQGRRVTTEKGLWLNAISFAPHRPEAYLFLSLWHESRQEYTEAYSYAAIGYELVNNEKPMTKNVGYENRYQLEFQKAVCSWWIGRAQESRDTFANLVKQGPTLSEKYKTMVQNNITSLGSGPNPFLIYRKGFHSELKYKFPGSETIENNFSQTYQDMFTLTMLNGKKDGTYLEIGAADPFYGSNSALLEQWGWTGTSLEILPHEVEKFKKHRKNEIILCDATKYDYSYLKGYVDYLQVDCEPPATTFEILTMLPWDKCDFGVITYEHDFYTDVTRLYRQKSRDFLTAKGYVLVASDIAPNETSNYEDWWVHPKYVSAEIIAIMQNTDDTIKNAEKYMLGKL